MERRGKLAVLAGSVALMATSFAVADAQELPPHGHMLVTQVEYDATGEPIGFRSCRELANGKALKFNAHHDHLHVGRAGEAQIAAGNAVVPMAPLSPFADCEALEAAFGG